MTPEERIRALEQQVQALTSRLNSFQRPDRFYLNKNIELPTEIGVKFGTTKKQKMGFYNTTPIIQRSGSAQTAIATTGATNSTPWGFTTEAQANAIVTLANELRAWAVAIGFIKGSA